jgi:hypothetical protein
MVTIINWFRDKRICNGTELVRRGHELFRLYLYCAMLVNGVNCQICNKINGHEV